MNILKANSVWQHRVKVMSQNGVLYCVKKSYFTKSLNKILFFSTYYKSVFFMSALKHLICIYKTCLENNNHTSCAPMMSSHGDTHTCLCFLSLTHTHTQTHLHVIICPTCLQQAINNSECYATYQKLPKTPEAR